MLAKVYHYNGQRPICVVSSKVAFKVTPFKKLADGPRGNTKGPFKCYVTQWGGGGGVGVSFHGKKHYVTLEWPLTAKAVQTKSVLQKENHAKILLISSSIGG